jgi:transcriptional regulator with XRE-family HTH domain
VYNGTVSQDDRETRTGTPALPIWGATCPALRLLPRVLEYLGFDPREPAGPGDLGELLRRARTAAGISIEELAKKWSLDRTTIWKWEHGRNQRRIRYRARIREFARTAHDGGERTENLGGRIPGYRERQGLRQKDLARLLGVTQQVISQWERGHGKPAAGFAERLGSLLRREQR